MRALTVLRFAPLRRSPLLAIIAVVAAVAIALATAAVAQAGNWSLATQQAKLTASDGAVGDQFGISVAVSGDTALVGASLDDVGSNTDQGSAYVFVRSGTTWTQQAKLTAADGAASDFFGFSVAVSGDTTVAGAYNDIVSGNSFQGSAYVFSRNGSTWTQQTKLTAADGAANDWFGYSVAVSGDTAVAGTVLDDVGSTDQGSAYVFTAPDDTDGDGILDSADNCPTTANADQADTDADGQGNACDPDDDNDGLSDGDEATRATDPLDPDTDNDGVLDSVDCNPTNSTIYPGAVEIANDGIDQDCNGSDLVIATDTDGDGVPNSLDNCPTVANPAQTDTDSDGLGDACDPDDDNDGFADAVDCNPTNPTIYPGATEVADGRDNDCDTLVDEGLPVDNDGDGFFGPPGGIDCNDADSTIYPGAVEIANDGIDQDCNGSDLVITTDTDGDGVPNSLDNCPTVANPAQTDTDSDGLGDACEAAPPTAVDLTPVLAALAVIEAKVDALEAKLDSNLDAPVSSRASQQSVDTIEAKLDAGINAPVGTRATQSSMDSLTNAVAFLEAKTDRIETKVLVLDDGVDRIAITLNSNLDTAVSSRSSQATVDSLSQAVGTLEAKTDRIETRLGNLDAPVTTRASQQSVNTIESKLDASLDARVSTRASQASADSLANAVGTLEAKADRTETAVSTRTSQSSVDSLNTAVVLVEAKIDRLGRSLGDIGLALADVLESMIAQSGAIEGKLDTSLDAKVSSRASQASVDSLGTAVGLIEAKIDFMGSALADILESMIAQSDAIEGKLDTSLDAKVSSRASQASVDAMEAKSDQIESDIRDLAEGLFVMNDWLSDAFDGLESQASAIEGKLDTSLDAKVSSRASQASVDSLASDLDTRADAIDLVLGLLEIKDDATFAYIVDTIDTKLSRVEAKADLLESKLDTALDARVSSRASQASVDALEAKSDRIEGKVDGLSADVAPSTIAIDVIEVTAGRRFFIQTALDGVPVDATITHLVGFRTSRSGSSTDLIGYMTPTRRATGVLDVAINPPRGTPELGILQFGARYTDGGGNVFHGVVIVRKGGERE